LHANAKGGGATDPDVVGISRDPELLTCLARSEAEIEIVVGDGRLHGAPAGRGLPDLQRPQRRPLASVSVVVTRSRSETDLDHFGEGWGWLKPLPYVRPWTDDLEPAVRHALTGGPWAIGSGRFII
jgi:hypothetical protein